MTLKSDAKFEEELPCCCKNDKNLVKFDSSTQTSQKFALWLVPIVKKYLMFDLKKYRRVIFYDTTEWCKIWWKTDSWFEIWHDEFDKFSPKHSKVSKLGLWWDPFVQSREYMSLKYTEGLCVMTMKNDAKFEEEFICHFKIDMRNLTNFDPSIWKSKKITL